MYVCAWSALAGSSCKNVIKKTSARTLQPAVRKKLLHTRMVCIEGSALVSSLSSALSPAHATALISARSVGSRLNRSSIPAPLLITWSEDAG